MRRTRTDERVGRGRWVLLALLAVASSSAALTSGCEPRQEQVATGPADINYWEQRKGQCDQILTTPNAFQLDDVSRCMKLWETYRTVGDLSVDLRSMYAVAFSLVWYQARDPFERAVADAALNRLCIPRHPMGNDGKIAEKVPDVLQCGATAVSKVDQAAAAKSAENTAEASKARSVADELAALRGSVQTRDVNDARRKKAQDLNRKALAAHNKKKYGEAIDLYEQSLASWPHYVTAKYNYICALALLGDTEGALQNLEDLYSWDDPEVNQRMIKARTDEDLFVLRDNLRFKQLTGYFRLVIANGAGQYGLEHVQRVVNEIEGRRYAIASTVNDKKPRMNPVIFYRPGFEQYADEFKLILNARKVDMAPIDWQTLDDMIIIWGQQEALNLAAGDVQMAPVVQGTRAQEKKGGLDDLTGAVKDAQGAVEDVKGTGEGLGDSIPK